MLPTLALEIYMNPDLENSILILVFGFGGVYSSPSNSAFKASTSASSAAFASAASSSFSSFS